MFGFQTVLQNGRNWQDAATAYGQMWLSAGEVIWLRSVQMMTGTMTQAEIARMFIEKPVAFAQAAQEAGMAVSLGKDPATVARLAVSPLSIQASTNARRLRS
ncbi:hypothetical protein [Tropicimonas sediminicola]|uniref:Uncharacterized protein n=1 Tax=Tropicimonas sediminicola TaxID=1031541 RepID=A0A239LSA0_9RHOB|nr:hypothetical protein [Tropicimonas sediminicola]SNT33321.1 hypothetical protein SAMN05421757_11110 [Tropicimonas sediminicola]